MTMAPERESRVAIRTPGSRVLRMEQHDEAHRIWTEAGVRGRVLVHVDAHHDMWWFDHSRSMTIANFVCAALKDGLVGEMFWVVPDASWERPDSKRALARHLKRLRASYPDADSHVHASARRLSTRVLGKHLTVCSLDSLPDIDAPVLLDLDVDFLVIPFVSQGEADVQAPKPWCWPHELLDRLAAGGVRSDLVTIAYSIDGGYTPLKWKFLGDELAARLGALGVPLEGFEHLRRGALEALRGNHAEAARVLSLAAAALPESAAPDYHLACCYRAMGRQPEARDAYWRAIARDATYRTPYNNDGLSLYTEGRLEGAEREWTQALELDPTDGHSYLGLARVAARRKDWPEAARHASRALALDEGLVDGHRILGRVLAVQGRHDEAIQAYERSLRLVFARRKSITAVPTSCSEDRIVDPEHFAIFARLARLYSAKGDAAAAIENYRMALVGRRDGLGLRLDLAWLYVRQNRFAAACREAASAIRIIPAEIAAAWKRFRSRLRQSLRHRPRMLTT